MIRTVKRGQQQAAGAVRFSVGRKSSGTGAGCRPLHVLANPFKIKPHGPYTREESLAYYGRWLEEKIAAKDGAVCTALNTVWRAAKAGEVELECCCKPLACHADAVRKVVEQRL